MTGGGALRSSDIAHRKREIVMSVKKVALYALLAFAAFFLLSRPTKAATAVTSTVTAIEHGADQLAVFFTHVLT